MFRLFASFLFAHILLSVTAVAETPSTLWIPYVGKYYQVMCSESGDSLFSISQPLPSHPNSNFQTDPILRVRLIDAKTGSTRTSYDIEAKYPTGMQASIYNAPYAKLYPIQSLPYLYYLSNATTISINDARNNTPLHTILFQAKIYAIQTSPSGVYSYVTTADKRYHIVDNMRGTIIFSSTQNAVELNATTFKLWSSNDSLFVLRENGTNNTKKLRCYDIASNKFYDLDASITDAQILSSSWNPLLQQFVYRDNTTVYVYSLFSNKKDSISTNADIEFVRWSYPYSQRLWVFSRNNNLTLWDAETKSKIRNIQADTMFACTWNDTKSLFAYITKDTIHLVQTDSGAELSKTFLSDSLNYFADARWLDNNGLFSVSGHIYNLRRGSYLGKQSASFYTAKNTDLCYLAVGSRFARFNSTDGSVGNAFPSQEIIFPISNVSFSPDGTKLASASQFIQIWDTNTGAFIAEKEYSDVASATWSPDSARIFVKRKKNVSYTIINAQTLDSLYDIPANESLLGFSTDGHFVITQRPDSATILIRDIHSAKIVSSYTDNNSTFFKAAALSPDNNLLAIADGYALRLVDLSQNRVVRSFSTETSLVYAPVFSRTGQYLAFRTALSDDTLYIVRLIDTNVTTIHTPCVFTNLQERKDFSGTFSNDESRYLVWGCGFVIHEYNIPDRNLINTNLSFSTSVNPIYINPKLTHYAVLSPSAKNMSIYSYPGAGLVIAEPVSMTTPPEAVWSRGGDKVALVETTSNSIAIISPQALRSDNPSSAQQENIEPIATTVLLYPNPSSGDIHVNAEGQIITALRVTDILGSEILMLHPHRTEMPLQNGLLQRGAYFLSIELKNGTHQYKKVVIQ